MKWIAPVTIKFILAGLFLYNIGLFSLLSNVESTVQPPQKENCGREDIQYLNEKVRRAQELGANYGPENYFSDLTEIQLKEKKNDFDRGAVIYIQSSINNLLSIFSDNVSFCKMHGSEKDFNEFLQRLSIARDKHQEIVDPGCKKREAEFNAKVNRSGFWTDTLLSFLSWLGIFYLKNFLLAFVLIWIWWYQEKERIKINNPLSFFICLVFYPITIIRVWRKSLIDGTRMFAMSIEFKRRQTDIFSMISDDELTDIKRFVKSNFKVSDYHNYLDNRGLIRQQSFLPAVVISLIFLIVVIPRVSASATDYPVANAAECHLDAKAPPIINVGDVNFHGGETISLGIMASTQFIFHTFFFWWTVFHFEPGQNSGFKTNPDPIPLFVNNCKIAYVNELK